MKLYHGSYAEIDVIDLSKSKPYKDFGKAFYLTKYREQAEIWAVRQGKEHKTNGIITEFEFDEYAYEDEDLKILKFDGYCAQWFAFCTLESLQMLEKVNKRKFINDIDDLITQLLVTEQNMTEQDAIDFYFQSETYGHLIDEKTKLYTKNGTEIYELLKKELDIK